MRTKYSFLNAMANSGTYVLNLILSFIARTVFIRILAKEYLGVGGLFGNILSVLCLAELGIGTAMIFHLYQPIAENNQIEIRKLMNLYRKLYGYVAAFVGIVGASLIPFLDLFVKDTSSIAYSELQLYYVMYLINAVASYLLGYKRAIIDGHQKGYISTLFSAGFMSLQFILQIIVLVVYRSFFIYLLMQILCNIATNIAIAIKANKMFPYLKEDTKSMPSVETRKSIFKNVGAMSMHKLGDVMVNSTDSLIISTFVGLASVGIFDNYRMLLGSVNAAINGIMGSFVASIGNLGVTEDKERVFDVYNTLQFIGFWIHSYATVAFLVLFNPFIEVWAGEDYLFPMSVVLLYVINFYTSGMRKVTLNFRDAMGLYWYDRYKPIFEVIVNLVVSIILVIRFGIVGVLIGTLVSTMGVCFWVEALVTYKYGFHKPLRHYFKQFGIYTLSLLFAGGITYYVCNAITLGGFLEVIIKLVICTLLYNVIIVVLYMRTRQFKEFMEKILSLLKGFKGRKNNPSNDNI